MTFVLQLSVAQPAINECKFVIRNSGFPDAFQHTDNVAGTGAAPEGIDQKLGLVFVARI